MTSVTVEDNSSKLKTDKHVGYLNRVLVCKVISSGEGKVVPAVKSKHPKVDI